MKNKQIKLGIQKLCELQVLRICKNLLDKAIFRNRDNTRMELETISHLIIENFHQILMSVQQRI